MVIGISLVTFFVWPFLGPAPSPVMASLALAAGSVFFLWNSLRLRRLRSVEFKP